MERIERTDKKEIKKITKILETLEEYKTLSKKEYKKVLIELQNYYSYDNPLLSDAQFDFYQEYYSNKYNEEWEYSESLPADDKVLIEYSMPSLRKYKGASAKKDIEKWRINNPGEYIIQDKLDGCSLQYSRSEGVYALKTCGNGTYGRLVSQAIPYLNLPKINKDFCIRGELIISYDAFEEFTQLEENLNSVNKLNKIRNTISGLLNSTTGEPSDPMDSKYKQLYSIATFVTYEVQYLEGEELDTLSQLKYLKSKKFNVVWYTTISGGEGSGGGGCKVSGSGGIERELTIETLESILTKRVSESEYPIDGIVCKLVVEYTPNDTPNTPTNAFAFKMDRFFEATVIDVEWNLKSKDGVIVPKIIIEPVFFLGSNIGKCTGKNAKFIIDNGIGAGAIIIATLGGEIIPDCVHIIKEASEVSLPNIPATEYEWDANKVHFRLVNSEESPEVQIERMIYFMKCIRMQTVGPSTVETLYYQGFNTLKKIFEISPKSIEGLDKIGKVKADKICRSIREAITNCKLKEIMAGTCIFGRHIGSKKCKMLLEAYPNILDMNLSNVEESTELLSGIKGFAHITANIFVVYMPEFIDWLNEHPMVDWSLDVENELVIDKSGEGISRDAISRNSTIINISFTGQKPKKDELLLMKSKNMVNIGDVTKESDMLVVKDTELDKMSNNQKKAIKYGIPIIIYSEFLKMLE